MKLDLYLSLWIKLKIVEKILSYITLKLPKENTGEILQGIDLKNFQESTLE